MAASVLVFAGSTRTGSFNQKLAALVVRRLRAAGAEVTALSLADYPLAIYQGDEEAAHGPPDNAVKLHALFAAHGGVFVAAPEYNAGMTPLLKNTIDWVSRVRENGGMAAAFGRPVFALGAASNSPRGGYRGLIQLRQTLELGTGALVIPPMIAVAGAATAFTEAGELADKAPSDLLDAVLRRLISEIGLRAA